MANILEEYIKQLQSTNTAYTPLTDEQIAQKAKDRYQAVYDQNRLSAQQQYDAQKLARDQQLAALLDQYALQREQSAENYQKAADSAVRGALNRGMQRSSYLNATVGNIGIKGAEAQQAINKNQEGSVRNAAEQQALAAQQLAAQLSQYDKSQLADQLAYQDELADREYNRGLVAADRANQIAGDIYNAQLYAQENGLFGYGGSSGGGSSGGSYRNSGGGSSGTKSSASSSLFDSLNAASGISAALASGVSAVKAGTAAVKKKTTSGGGGGVRYATTR